MIAFILVSMALASDVIPLRQISGRIPLLEGKQLTVKRGGLVSRGLVFKIVLALPDQDFNLVAGEKELRLFDHIPEDAEEISLIKVEHGPSLTGSFRAEQDIGTISNLRILNSLNLSSSPKR